MVWSLQAESTVWAVQDRDGRGFLEEASTQAPQPFLDRAVCCVGLSDLDLSPVEPEHKTFSFQNVLTIVLEFLKQ